MRENKGIGFKDEARLCFEKLAIHICQALEDLEQAYPLDDSKPPGCFERMSWQREPSHDEQEGDPGGGVRALLKGRLFEKAGVNVSTVRGRLTPEFAQEIQGADENDRSFWASGLSLVLHPYSPHIPPVHMNVRHIITQRAWFGGALDLNPIRPYSEDTELFHAALSDLCARYDPNYYPCFRAWCDRYFLNSHRGEPRGVGGIFFDHLEGTKAFAFARGVAEDFLTIYEPLIRRHWDKPWTAEDRHYQLIRRGRYVEFNLLYDRGTRFGLMTGGDPEAILMSLPPQAAWL